MTDETFDHAKHVSGPGVGRFSGANRKTVAVSKEYDTPVGSGIIFPTGGNPRIALSADTSGQPLSTARAVALALDTAERYGHASIDARSGRCYQHQSREKANRETGETDNRFSYDAPVAETITLKLSTAKGRARLEAIIRDIRADILLRKDKSYVSRCGRATHVRLVHLGNRKFQVTPVLHCSDHVRAANATQTGTYAVCRGNQPHRWRTSAHELASDVPAKRPGNEATARMLYGVVRNPDARRIPEPNPEQRAADPRQTGASSVDARRAAIHALYDANRSGTED